MTYRSDLDAANARAHAAEHEVKALEATAHALATPLATVPAPLVIEQSTNELVVSWRRPREAAFEPLFFGPLFAAIAPVLRFAVSGDDLFSWVLALVFAPVSLLGLVMVYAGLVTLVNRTRIVVTRETVRSLHGPLPWRRSQTHAVADLRRVFAETESPEHLRAQFGAAEIRLIEAPSADSADYLRAAIERFVGLSPPSP